MNDEQLFVIYANYPVIDNLKKYINYLKSYSIHSPWGKTYQSGRIYRPLNLDLDEIEEQRNLLFQEALTAITNGARLKEIASLDKILQEVNRTKPIVTYQLAIDTKGNEIFIRPEDIGDIESKTRSEYLYNLACHDLISFLSVKGNRQKIKRCPYCNLFFTAKNNKRKYCYVKSCDRKYEKDKKKKQRNKASETTSNPVP